jgi:hypothetical protein
MQSFLARHGEQVQGVLSGFDRVLFRGTLRSISYVAGLEKWLSYHDVLYKDFGRFAERISQRLKAHARGVAARHGRPYMYLPSAALSKEAYASRIAEQDGVTTGLVCVLAAVEPCQTFALRKEPATQTLRLISTERKCLHLYFYYQDREFGLMHVRLQTWLPMTIQVCVNGREYLARRLERAGIAYEQRDNCFVWIADVPRAQRMLDALRRRQWARYLTTLARRVNPWLAPRQKMDLLGYYWTFRQTEYATDIMFRRAQDLAALYPALQRHAIAVFGATDVLRFLGRRTTARFRGEVTSDLGFRYEGTRIKHRVEENSIKMYDKQGSVLRIETTINNPRRFKVRRMTTRAGHRQLGWLPMRKSVADLARRVDVSSAANERYVEALGVVGAPAPTRHLLDPVSRPIARQGRRYRALRPIAPHDSRLLALLTDGRFHLQGFRNQDVRQHLFPGSDTRPETRRRVVGRVTRLLRLLRAHRLIRKVSGTFYYRVTKRGQQVMATALKIRELPVLAAA